MQPVFIIGCPRSGTTYFLNALAAQGEFAWVSGKLNNSPDQLELTNENHVFDRWLKGIRMYTNPDKCGFKAQHPVECWNFWNLYLPGFQWQFSSHKKAAPVTFEELSHEQIVTVQHAVEQVCQLQGKAFFLSKYTDFARIKLIKLIWPNAKFIHLKRDGRAVASSYKEKIDKSDFHTWEEREYWIESWSEEDQHEFQSKYSDSKLALVAFQWKNFLKNIEEESSELSSETYLEITYDQLTKDPETWKRICEFSGVTYNRRLRYFLKYKYPSNMDYKWRERLNEMEIATLEQIIPETAL